MKILKNNKAYYFSLDALIATIIIIGFLFIMHPVTKIKAPEMNVQTDLIEILSSLKVADYAKTSSTGGLEAARLLQSIQAIDNEESVLEYLVQLYALGNETQSDSLARIIIEDDIGYNGNIDLWFADHKVYSNGDITSASDLSASKQIVSGLKKPATSGGELRGYSAIAKLLRAYDSEYFYFGGFIGQGDITAKMHYNGTIKGVYVEGVFSKDFEVYVNSNKVTELGVVNASTDVKTPIRFVIPISYFASGDNYIKFSAANSTERKRLYISGGYIRILYSSQNDYKAKKRFYLPGIDGIINLYDSFYIPSDSLQNITIHLNYSTNYTNFFVLGNVTIFNGTSTSYQVDDISDSMIRQKIRDATGKPAGLEYSDFVKKTIPIRYGLENFSQFFGGAAADIALVTDTSGSMGYRMDGIGSYGTDRTNCSDPRIINDSLNGPTQKMSVARCLNKNFTEIVFRSSTTKVAPIKFSTASTNNSLSSSRTWVDGIINGYSQGGSTCMCCGIRDSIYDLIPPSWARANNPYSDSLLAYYPFDNNAKDYGEHSFNGSVAGATLVSGKIGQAYKFDGRNDNIVVPFNPIQKIINNFSICSWVNWDSIGTDQAIVSKESVSSGSGFRINLNSTGFLEFRSNVTSASKFKPKTNIWYHICVVLNSSNRVSFYVNGAFNNTAVGNFVIPNENDLLIGSYRTNFFNGSIDDLRIYSKALSLDEIQNLSNPSPSCNNGKLESGEICDSDVKGCNGWYGEKHCKSDCSGYDSCINIGSYGDGYLSQAEECDDGNLANGDGCSSQCKQERKKFMVLMSDGAANVLCGKTIHNESDGLGEFFAIEKACSAKGVYTIYTIGFGRGSYPDPVTLTEIANCGNGSFYQSDSYSGLRDIFENISSKILNTTYSNQSIASSSVNVTTNLSPESYIEVEYAFTPIPFGNIITAETPISNNLITNFTLNLPDAESYLEANAISYSGDLWTNRLDFTNATGTSWNIFNLSKFGSIYVKLGDPYIINIPNSSLAKGNNTITIMTASAPSQPGTASLYDKAIFTLKKKPISYSPIMALAKGCRWNMTFFDGEQILMDVYLQGFSYNSEDCRYGTTSIFDNADAVQYATNELLKQIDFDSDGKLDVKFDQSELKVDPSVISGIPWTWWTEVRAETWR